MPVTPTGPSDRRIARGDGRSAHHELRPRQAVARSVRAAARRGARHEVARAAASSSRNDLDLKADRQYTAQKKAELGIRVDTSPANRVDENDYIINVFAGNNRRGAWDVPRAIRMINIFGGAELDFSGRALHRRDHLHHGVLPVRRREHSRARRDAHDLESAVHLRRRRQPRAADGGSERAAAGHRGPCLFGGVDIRVKKTPKQRLTRVRRHAALDVRPGAAARVTLAALRFDTSAWV